MQTVSDNTDLGLMDIDVAYSVMVDGAQSIKLSDVLNLSARGARGLIIRNSDIVISGNMPNVYVLMVKEIMVLKLQKLHYQNQLE